MVRRKLADSRGAASELIAAGRVTVEGAPAAKPARQVLQSSTIVVSAPPQRFVSRGGHKLDHALTEFGVEVHGRRCLDAGVSTGGFTDCLLQWGAAHVQAFDVGYGQVHERLRTDARVRVVERTNVRNLGIDDVEPPEPDLVVVDLSFISLRLVIPALRRVVSDTAEAIVLIKPQFEAGRANIGKGGVVRDATVWRRAITDVLTVAAAHNWNMAGITRSPLRGPAGNVEFLAHLVPAGVNGGGYRGETVEAQISAVIPKDLR